jgi:hypothetical protein
VLLKFQEVKERKIIAVHDWGKGPKTEEAKLLKRIQNSDEFTV